MPADSLDSLDSLDLDFVRAQFPGLRGGDVLADNAGGSVPCIDVIDAVRAFMSEHMVQLGASYDRSVRAGAAVHAGRVAAARLVGGRPDSVVLGSSTTVNVQTLARGLGATLEAGDEVVVTNLDHEANIGPWRRLAERGVVIREWRFDPRTAELRIEDLERLLGPRTRIVAFTHVSNVVGRIHDVRAIADLVRAAGALSIVDGVAFAPHRRVDVEALGVDVYMLSLYKVFGPHQGLLWARRAVLERARGQNHDFIGEAAIPSKLEPGNVVFETTAGLVGILGYLERVARHHGIAEPRAIESVFRIFAGHEAVLAERLLSYLRDRDDVAIVGPRDSEPTRRVPTVAFTVRGQDPASIVAAADRAGVGIRFGHFYARRAIEAMGLLDTHGVVRVSLLHYNTLAEVDRVIEVLAGIPRT